MIENKAICVDSNDTDKIFASLEEGYDVILINSNDNREKHSYPILVNIFYKENQELKKQKDDVVEYIKEAMYSDSFTKLPSGKITDISYCVPAFEDLLRMLGEIDG